jgi:EAL domain-containing protein (putative c-di-GMP-specific phosphodiesterase class I)
VDHERDGRQVGEALLSSFDGGFDLGGGIIEVAPSVGFAISPRHGATAAELSANAMLALSEAQHAQGSRVRAYDEDFRIRTSERGQVRRELLQALKNDEFRLHYQPQVGLADGRIHGVEALLRWQHPTRGLLQPGDFLLDVEDGGMSLPIGWWTLEAACAQLAAWRAEGLPAISMGVNLFASQFRSEKLVKTITGLIETYGIDPGQLELEVTETIAMLNDEVGLRSFRELRAMGVRIAFDDFGTGYASLSSLQQFPLTTLKLDRGFICNITTVPGDAVITRSMLSLANDLGLTAIAEGIETREQEALLRMLGCRLGQGYLYSKPLASADMGAMLASEANVSGRYEIPAKRSLS